MQVQKAAIANEKSKEYGNHCRKRSTHRQASKHKGAVCLFLEKLGVPFDNNQAERDIRNIKTKAKVCVCFRNRTDVEEYIGLISFISAARKNGFDSYHAVMFALMCIPLREPQMHGV